MTMTTTTTRARQKEFHIAPMLDVSKPEFLNFVRILTKRAILWTEMIVDETIIHSKDLDMHLLPVGEVPVDPSDERSDDAQEVQGRQQQQSSSRAKSQPQSQPQPQPQNYQNQQHLKPIICQIGGRNPDYCGRATSIVESYGYNEVNLNIDCPSSRVSGKRKFGAILMHDRQTAFDIASAMQANTTHIPISIKTRVGIELDDEDHTVLDTLDHLVGFLEEMRVRGCRKFVIHARKCVIGGLSPAQNRLVPPLNYPRVYAICHRFPDCEFVINGGIHGLKASKILCEGTHTTHGNRIQNANGNEKEEQEEGDTHHTVPCKICNATNGSCTVPPIHSPPNLSGVMLGRAIIDSPSMFWDVDRYFYGEPSNPTNNRQEVLERYCQYLERTYPRRCCDDDERVTSRIPAPSISGNVDSFSKNGCKICAVNSDGNEKRKHEEMASKTHVNDSSSSSKTNINKTKIKITSRVIDRSLKPILNIFFGLPKSKQFRRECDRLSRDKRIRNCGPGFILRSAIATMPNELLLQPFERTEDMDDGKIAVHVGPSIDNNRCKGCR